MPSARYVRCTRYALRGERDFDHIDIWRQPNDIEFAVRQIYRASGSEYIDETNISQAFMAGREPPSQPLCVLPRKENTMEDWQYLLALLLPVAGVLAVRSAVIKKRKRKERDFPRRLETVLQSKETLKVVCPQRKGNCILTSRRVLFETGEGFTAVPISTIKRLQGVTKEGKTTVSPAKMAKLTIKADKEYTIYNTSESFEELAKQLKTKVRTRKKTPC